MKQNGVKRQLVPMGNEVCRSSVSNITIWRRREGMIKLIKLIEDMAQIAILYVVHDILSRRRRLTSERRYISESLREITTGNFVA